jgi:ribosomal-protein-alanine acetyltransferase
MTRIRRAQPADLDGIMALETATFPRDAWSRTVMRSELGGRHGYYLAAVDDDRIVGYAGLLAPAGSGQADIQTIAVAPEARRSGLGRELMTALVAEAARRRAAHVFLEVRADNDPARLLYRDLGFELISVREHYYQPDDVSAEVMRLSLSAESTS